MCAVWSDLLGNNDRVNRCLQQPGIDVGAVRQHYDDLYEYIESLRNDERFDAFQDHAKKMVESIIYADDNRRVKRREKAFDENDEEEETPKCGREKFRVETYFSILDRLLTEIHRRRERERAIRKSRICLDSSPRPTASTMIHSLAEQRNWFQRTLLTLKWTSFRK